MVELDINPTLLKCVISGTIEGLTMAEVDPKPVGASRFITATRPFSVIVGLHGDHNGQMTLNFSEAAVKFLAGRLLGEESREIDEDSVDAICEIGNMVAGRYKVLLTETDLEFRAISLPALIVGANYNVYHVRGITTVSVEFELPEMGFVNMPHRFFTASISLMRTPGI
jgi:chemotaxis protein CheX